MTHRVLWGHWRGLAGRRCRATVSTADRPLAADAWRAAASYSKQDFHRELVQLGVRQLLLETDDLVIRRL